MNTHMQVFIEVVIVYPRVSAYFACKCGWHKTPTIVHLYASFKHKIPICAILPFGQMEIASARFREYTNIAIIMAKTTDSLSFQPMKKTRIFIVFYA